MNLMYRSVGLTNRGKVRLSNEDNLCIDNFSFFFAAEESSSDKTHRYSATSIDQTTLAVCDGIGGCEYGEIASELTAKEVAVAHERLAVLGDYASNEIDTLLLKAMIQSANRIVSDTAGRLGEHRIGSTLAAMHIRNSSVHYCNVGDSRIYLCRANRLIRLSTDHTQYQACVDQGITDMTEAEINATRNRLTAFIGMDANSERIRNAQIASHTAELSDIFLLCSDGLTNMLSDERICDILVKAKDSSQLEAAAEQLMQEALEAGGNDNISLVLTYIDKSEDTNKDSIGHLANSLDMLDTVY